MVCWVLNNLVGIVGILVDVLIAVGVFMLSRRLGLKDKLAHKDSIRKQVEPILQEIRKGISNKCELVNVKKYLTYYPHSNKENRYGLTYFGGELKALRFDGVEFFSSVKELYQTPDGNYSLNKENNRKLDSNVFEVGVVPYEWIEYVDPRGDEFSYRPQFFASFKGPHKTPYKYVVYYKKSEVYHPESDPMDMKWQQIEIVGS